MKFRKKPVEIEAMQFDGSEDSAYTIAEKLNINRKEFGYIPKREQMGINTLEGNMIAAKGDWIIKGVEGEFYPCKPDIFGMTYDKVDNTEDVRFGTLRNRLNITAEFVPPIDFQIDTADLCCKGCGKPKVLCLHDTTGCQT